MSGSKRWGMSSSGLPASEAKHRLPGRPVVLLGLDGLGQEFLDSPLVSDAAPNLRALLRDGGLAPLRSTFPPYTAPAWTSITTGVGPGRHGVFGFTDTDGHAVSDAAVAVPRLWDYVGQAGGRSVVLNMPITHPPRPIEGVLISGMPVPPGAAYTAPAGQAAALEADGYVVDVAVREDGDEGPATLRRLQAMTEARGRAAVRLAESETWDLFVAVFVLPDRLGHPWWKYLVASDAGDTADASGTGGQLFDSGPASKIRGAARECLRALDRAVVDLMAALPANAAVIACSDHGFGSLRADAFFDVALAGAGLIDAPTGSALLGRIGRSAVGRRLPGRVRRAGRSAARVDAARRGQAWTATSYECGVRLADPAVADEVIELLHGLTDPDGRPVVAAVHRRADLFHGPHVDRAPDLLVELADESVDLHDGLHAPAPWVSRHDVPWGTHRVDGIVAVRGEPMTAKGEAADVAATALDLLGLDVAGLDGRSLVAGRGDHRAVSATVEAGDNAAYSEAEEQAVLEHLKSLGYVD
jgi:predicted AlkP superfamily phosphohydrolase/phosphomutase